jgi:hypothetical protein
MAGCLGLCIDGNEVVHTACGYTMLSIVGTVHVGDVDETDSVPIVGPVKTAQDDAR